MSSGGLQVKTRKRCQSTNRYTQHDATAVQNLWNLEMDRRSITHWSPAGPLMLESARGGPALLGLQRRFTA